MKRKKLLPITAVLVAVVLLFSLITFIDYTRNKFSRTVHAALPTEVLLESIIHKPSVNPKEIDEISATETVGQWIIECVDCPRDFSSISSLQLDVAGYPHIAYGEENLYYAWYDGINWHYEIIDDSPGVGASASLALDGNSFAHISYFDKTHGNLKYAYEDYEGWHLIVVDSYNGEMRGRTSLALDQAGYAHISYTFSDSIYADGNLKYAYQDATGWNPFTVASSGGIGGVASLALDESGYPHISYSECASWMEPYGTCVSSQLKYAMWDLTGWHFTIVDGVVWQEYGYSSLGLDEAGFPHISYLDITNDDLKYAYQDAGGWHYQIVDNEGIVGVPTSIALNEAGFAHISYISSSISGMEVRYAFLDDVGWNIFTLYNEENCCGITSLAETVK